MRKWILLLLMGLAIGSLAYAAQPRLAVIDFTVASDNPKLKFVGKGLSEMVAINMAASRGLVLVERELREQLLGELEFSLSAVAEPSAQLRVGRLLSAAFLMYGSVTDMDSSLLVACKIVDVETGQVVWSDKHLGPLADYNAISGQLASSALAGLGIQNQGAAVAAAARPAAPAPAAPSRETRESTILSFSSAVDHFDKKEMKEAVVELRKAKAADPGNAAVGYYLAKLTGNSPRFQVDLARYAPIYNPAGLGLMEDGSVYVWFSSSPTIGSVSSATAVYMSKPTTFDMSFDIIKGLYYSEDFGKYALGFTKPIGSRLGMSAEVEVAGRRAHIISLGNYAITQNGTPLANLGNVSYGIVLGLGYRLLPELSLGIGARATSLKTNMIGKETGMLSLANPFTIFPEAAAPYFGLTLGLAYQDERRALEANIEAIWSNQADFYLVEPAGGFESGNPGTVALGTVPLVLAAGATKGLFDKTLFCSLQAVGEAGLDERSLLAARVVPGLEWWYRRTLALRAGYEFDYVQAKTGGELASTSGSGYLFGASLLLGAWELTLNLEQRHLPLRDLPGSGSDEFAVLAGLVWHGLGERKGND